YNNTLALAGIFQAVGLVKQIAFTGQCEQQPFKTSINTLYITEPQDAASVYSGAEFLQLGLEKLIDLLSSPKKNSDADLARYVLGLIYLERKLTRNQQLMSLMTERITKAKQQLVFFETTHPNALANLADIYLNTLSTFKWRIQVIGKPELLTQPAILDKIRALLLAGIRSTVLWRQTGGNRLQLLFRRKKIIQMAQRILSESKT
ncbi:MAG: hflD, partial [Gammaproteobacteria bacterium]|nr:hflD [Gammaproteobacteria bacterium]